MEDTYTPARLSGALLILGFCSFAGIMASVFYSGYVAIAIGIIVIALALATKSRRQTATEQLCFQWLEQAYCWAWAPSRWEPWHACWLWLCKPHNHGVHVLMRR